MRPCCRSEKTKHTNGQWGDYEKEHKDQAEADRRYLKELQEKYKTLTIQHDSVKYKYGESESTGKKKIEHLTKRAKDWEAKANNISVILKQLLETHGKEKATLAEEATKNKDLCEKHMQKMQQHKKMIDELQVALRKEQEKKKKATEVQKTIAGSLVKVQDEHQELRLKYNAIVSKSHTLAAELQCVKEELSGTVQDNLIDRTRLLVLRKYRKKEKMKMGELMVKIKEEVEELFWERLWWTFIGRRRGKRRMEQKQEERRKMSKRERREWGEMGRMRRIRAKRGGGRRWC